MASRPPAAPATLVPDTPPPAAIASSTACERIPRVREQSLEPEPPPSAAKPAPVRAFLRLRPSLHPAAPRVVHRLSNHPEKVSLARSPSHSDPVYTFNDVFDEDASQDDVFRAAALPLLTRLFDRKTPQNTTSAYTGDAGGDSTPLNDAASDELIMAYGPSGSGKTFSLNSILAKAVDFLVRKISPAEGDNNTNFPVINIKPLRWNEVQYSAAPGEASFSKSSASGFHTLWISFVEIWNDTCFDLLDPSLNLSKGRKLKLHSDVFILKDLTEIQIVNVKQAMDLISQVHELRRTAETKVNRASSRSHLITTLKLLKFTNSSNTPQISRIAIADLAGSENAKQTGAGGDLLDEAITINLSLHYLSECVKGMVKSQKTGTCNLKSKTAFRNCQLTQFLYPYFRSGLVTFLFHVNPANEEQTKAVLDFSQQSCRLMTYIPSSNNGKQPNRTRSQPAEKPASGEIARLKAEVERLRVLEKQHSAAQQRVRQLEDIAADFRAQWRNLLDTTHLEEKRRKDEYLRMLTDSEIRLREATLRSERDVSEKLEKKLEVAEMLSAGKICELQRELEQKETESQELQEQLLSEMATMEEKLQEFIEKAESDRKLISQLNARIEELQNSANCSTNIIEVCGVRAS
ncbi:Kinesin-like protein kif20a [Entophlyctis luteolus]|nr:Kinesin-like protein kif20a [Entophlyctis luteolus]